MGNSSENSEQLKKAGKQANKSPSKEVGSPTETCPLKSKEKPRIISVEFLDGSKSLAYQLASQYVNLPSEEEKWVDGWMIKNIDRIGNIPRIKVCFNKPGVHSFKIKLKIDKNNCEDLPHDKEYPAEEHLKASKEIKSYQTNGEGQKILRCFHLSQGGNDTYTLLAKDNYGTPAIKSKSSIQTMRAIFCTQTKMKEITGTNVNWKTIYDEYKRHGIDLFGRCEDMEDIPYRTFTPTGSETIRKHIRNVYQSSQASTKEPYSFVIAFVDHVVLVKDVYIEEILSDKTSNLVRIKVRAPLPKKGGIVDYMLYNKQVKEDWLISATIDGKKIDTDEIKAISDPKHPETSKEVSINLSKFKNISGKKLQLKIKGQRCINGVSPVKRDKKNSKDTKKENLVIIATRVNYRKRDINGITQTIIHELGHGIGMVAKSVKTHYTYHGHQGNHCFTGIPKNERTEDNYRDKKGTCVMFGAGNDKRSPEFCKNCTKAVRELDLRNENEKLWKNI